MRRGTTVVGRHREPQQKQPKEESCRVPPQQILHKHAISYALKRSGVHLTVIGERGVVAMFTSGASPLQLDVRRVCSLLSCSPSSQLNNNGSSQQLKLIPNAKNLQAPQVWARTWTWTRTWTRYRLQTRLDVLSVRSSFECSKSSSNKAKGKANKYN